MTSEDRGVAIVAIPEKNDPVWQISSEPVPHLTLLYLGDNSSSLNNSRVAGVVQHVVSTTLSRFGLSVDRRGVLGAKNADVIFFRQNYGCENLRNVRTYLLQDPAIHDAYNSVEQYPEWNPHLTLGYPETPAHPDNREYPGINYVRFDRIGFWTNNYEGIEYVLDSYDNNALAQTTERGEAFLRHYGVLGMHWGVRKAKKPAHPGSVDYKTARKIQQKAREHGVKSLTNKELEVLARRKAAEQRHHQLNSQESALNKHHNTLKNVLAVAGTATALYTVATSPAAKAGAQLVQKLVIKAA